MFAPVFLIGPTRCSRHAIAYAQYKHVVNTTGNATAETHTTTLKRVLYTTFYTAAVFVRSDEASVISFVVVSSPKMCRERARAFSSVSFRSSGRFWRISSPTVRSLRSYSNGRVDAYSSENRLPARTWRSFRTISFRRVHRNSEDRGRQ